VRQCISKALTLYEPELRPALKKNGFLTRDSRVVERKKYASPARAAASSSRNANTAPRGPRPPNTGRPREGRPFCFVVKGQP